ncbi:Transcription factor CBF/NF-Y/archaeal histone [Lasiodiplodia theobromae]|uniref:NCT transcriptional regulatory complex subunit A n=1 Tax=Lasiodiplodia theobromae TaxID=45133 RepID=A0A5N5DK35_9PEZI|nr:Transcription factor [Lasiodiplodia theobromae]KAB2577244.1 DNA polymerase epsilon subunit C [Lasiodiplodia theobromae]KAF4538759.1 Transcription factor [Lasiodiplodia theobromae]KAF9637552.1 Transcription factor CBF/NF-Y/archaeal histone [Lasiodiplodia theobromae]
MEDPEDSYAPRSPDLSAYDHGQADPEPLHPQHQKYRGSISHAPPQSPYAPPNTAGAYNPPAGYFAPRNSISYPPPTMAAQMKFEGEDGQHWSPLYSVPTTLKTETMEPGDLMDANGGMIKSEPREQAPGVAEGIEVKTKFPAARIKRIMQADEDVGKVAQVTPHVVAKALELFMISLVTKAATEAKNRSSKRVSAAHLKQAVLQDEHFDFLNDIVNKVSDAPAPADRGGSPEEGEGKKRKAGRKKRKDSNDF